ncbi:DnaB domain protein helicase domain protein [Streptomyces sp. CBMAI 2042]|uniref:AAA family ATPase n=1 Tax=Streptomyces sp. CBMAI 2042 TaxID=2305222 RepID=UPI000F2B7535|nr:AAA family ATPase [Streptomyces sp. CBMAI 2042]RLV66316.1 DnaB domain protein helicase domain protein [Streptomyces sp. CBMAI 2042]
MNPHPPADHDGLNLTTPHDNEAEDLVVGAVMHSTQAFNDASAAISRDDIYQPSRRLIWDTVAGLVASGTGPHPVLIRAEIEKQGRLREVDQGNLLIKLGTDYLNPALLPAFTERVYESARQRRYDAHSNDLKQAVRNGAAGDELDALVQAFHQGEQLRENTGRGPAHLVAALINWDSFFATDFGAIQLLPGKLMGPGQQITLVGDGKAGKSLFCQEWMWRMATGQSFLDDTPQPAVRILYLDAENGQEQVQERFLSFGAGPRNMGQLRYASFPPVRPLDTAGGGADLIALVKATGAELVVIDTVSRFISGPENDADTWLSLYRHTLLPLKRDRIASIRLDHFGKDKDRGGRGSSAKTQDVDHVWELSAQGGGVLSLKRTHTRTGIGPDQFTILRQARRDGDNWAHGGTRHIAMTYEADTGMAAVPGTVDHIISVLDRQGIPNDTGNRAVRQILAGLNEPGGNDKIAEAVRRRKARPIQDGIDVSGKRSGDHPEPRFPETFPGTHPGTGKTPGQTFPGNVAEHPGTPPVPHVPPSKRGNGEGTAEPEESEKPLCTVCNTPLHGYRADRGYDTCLGCDPTTGSHPAA